MSVCSETKVCLVHLGGGGAVAITGGGRDTALAILDLIISVSYPTCIFGLGVLRHDCCTRLFCSVFQIVLSRELCKSLPIMV
jgi:hypothetical protein